jgi:hypothetical protein
VALHCSRQALRRDSSCTHAWRNNVAT